MDKQNTTQPLQPGEALDRLVAEKMGYEWEEYDDGPDYSKGRWVTPENGNDAYPARWLNETGLDQPRYSTDIAAAWEVVEFMRNKSYAFHIYEEDRYDNHWWVAGFRTRDIMKPSSQFAGDTEPHAICLAFLAIENNKE